MFLQSELFGWKCFNSLHMYFTKYKMLIVWLHRRKKRGGEKHTIAKTIVQTSAEWHLQLNERVFIWQYIKVYDKGDT